ncbi:hypothetical protein TNCV_3366761 [Trichonephila clavipes]|nr:hypothetical protein TNCV_3366761 [Trichonephila clavipes]
MGSMLSILAEKANSFMAEVAFSADGVSSGLRRLSFLFRKNESGPHPSTVTMNGHESSMSFLREVLARRFCECLGYAVSLLNRLNLIRVEIQNDTHMLDSRAGHIKGTRNCRYAVSFEK